VALQDAATFAAATTITVSCGGFLIFAFDLVLTAIKVGTIHLAALRRGQARTAGAKCDGDIESRLARRLRVAGTLAGRRARL